MSIAPRIEHTDLRAAATPEDVERLCRESAENGFHGVCVNPIFVSLARRTLAVGRVVTVVGFPLGATPSEIKAAEARRAVGNAADEIDMVITIGAAKSGDYAAVTADVRAVRDAVPNATLKAILETGLFDADEIAKAALAAIDGGADFVKTSTGFGPRGATVEDIRILRHAVGDRARIKASGGIRTLAEALALIEAGADRIGTSNGVAIAREARLTTP